jgi:mannitol/fructose-specific phosphotransferase system IIA component (Ntr-type)
MDLASLLTTRVAIDELKAKDDQGVFDEVAAALASSSIIKSGDCTRIRDAFIEREKQGTTSLGNGLAVPHVFFEKVSCASLVVARSTSGVPMRAPDGKPIRIFFCLVASEGSREHYLHILRSIAKVARDKDWRRYMERAGTAAQIFDALIQGEKALSV